MPNIELHGFSTDRSAMVRTRVREACEGLSFAGEIVVTICGDTVQDLEGRDMPYLRVITSPDEWPSLKERLVPLGEDIEMFALGEWVPKKNELDLLLDMELWEFFSKERLDQLNPSVRTRHAVMNAARGMADQEQVGRGCLREVDCGTMRKFLAYYTTRRHLKEAGYKLGDKTANLIVAAIKSAGLPFSE